MRRAGRLVVLAVFLCLPSFAWAQDRSTCKQYGGTVDCWLPTLGPWKHTVCAEVGAFTWVIAAECEAQGGEWLSGNCQNLPPIDQRRPVEDADIGPLARDIIYHAGKPFCSGPDAGPHTWGVPVYSTLCWSGNGPVFSNGYEIHNNTDKFPVTGVSQSGGSCGTEGTTYFSAIRDRVVNCVQDYGSQRFTTGDLPALCTLYWNKPINPKQCTECDEKSGNPKFVGNPLDPVALVKRQLEVDYAGSGPHPLRFQRLYLSRSYNIDGKFWRHNYSSRINHQTFGTVPVVAAHRANGRTLSFKFDGTDYVADPDIDDWIVKLVDGGGNHIGWGYYEASTENAETYDAEGKLIYIADRAGLLHTLQYSTVSTPPAIAPRPGLLIQVVDAFGRTLNFAYDALGRMVTMQDPAGQTYTYTYLSQSGAQGAAFEFVTSVTYPDGKKRQYLYNEAGWIGSSAYEGRLTGIVDENNVRFASFRHESGFAMRTEHAGGVNRYTLGYGSWPTVTVTDPLGTVRTYAHQKIREVWLNTSITQPAASGVGTAQSTRTYDANGNLATSRDFNGNRTNYSFDLTRNLQTSRTEGLTSAGATTPQTRTISTAWHPTFRLPTQIAEPLKITTNVYDADGTACGARGALCSRTVQATTDANGSQGVSATPTGSPRSWTYTYNPNGSVLTVNGPRTDVSDVTSYTYYANNDPEPGKRGQVATITNAANHVTSITAYNLHGQPTTMVDANGVTSTLTYDERRRLTSRTTAGETTTYEYDGVGQLKKVILPDGSYLAYTYDNAHRLTALEDNQGNRITYALDNLGNRTQEQVLDPSSQLAQTRSRVFNNLGRLFRELGALSQSTEYAYDNQGNVISVKNPLNHVTTNQYDALNRLRQVTDPAPVSGVTQYAYNGQDQLVQVTDPRGLLTGYTVDGLGNLTQQSSPDTGSTVNTHDAAGNLLTQTNAKNQTSTYAYDALNRVTLITFHDGSTQTYGYDAGTNGIGRLTIIEERNASNILTNKTSYTYDQKGRVLSVSTEHAGVTYVVGYSYDSAGRMSGMTYPSGRTLAYSFDSLGRVSAINTTFSGPTQPIVSNVAYQPFGGVKSYTLGNGESYARSYDQDGRIGSYTLGGISYSVLYDDAGRVATITETLNAPNAHTYGYDALDRLTSAALPGTTYGYTYDGVGNRLTRTAGASTDSYVYSSTSNRIASITPPSGPVRSFMLDANGSTTADGNNTYGYDVRGRMVQSVSALGTTDYKLNALGQRMRKTNSATDTVFHYDTGGRLIAETSSSGTPKREIIYLGDVPVAVVQ